MIVQCPSCQSRFLVDVSKVKSLSSKGRCSVCGHVFALLENAVEDMEVASLRDRFERERAEKVKHIKGTVSGIYGVSPLPEEGKKEGILETKVRSAPTVIQETELDREGVLPEPAGEGVNQGESEFLPEFESALTTEQESKPGIQTGQEKAKAEDRFSPEFSDLEESPKLSEKEESSPSILEDDIDEWIESEFPITGEEAGGKKAKRAVPASGEGISGGAEGAPEIAPELESEFNLGSEPMDEGVYEQEFSDEPGLQGYSSLKQREAEKTSEDHREERPGSVGEKLSPPFEVASELISPTRRTHGIRVFLIIILILCASGGGWYLYRTGVLTSPHTLVGKIIGRFNAIRGKSAVTIYNLRNEQEPTLDGKLFAVRGMVENNQKKTVSYVVLEIRIFDGRGRVILMSTTVAGRVLKAEEISKMSVQNVFKTYRTLMKQNRKVSGKLAPKGKLPFLFLFDLSKFPKNKAKTFQVKILRTH